MPAVNWGQWATISQHKTVEERAACVPLLRAKFAAQCPDLPPPNVVVDTIADTLEGLYEARPFRHYMVDVPSMTVAYADLGRTPVNMKAKLTNAKAFLSELAAESVVAARKKRMIAEAQLAANKAEEAKIKDAAAPHALNA